MEKDKIRKDRLGPLARKAALLEHKRSLENFNRFNEVFVDTYKAERNIKELPRREEKAQEIRQLEQFIKPSTIEHFDRTERLSKRLARLGVSSRRQAEKLIQ